MLVADMMRCDVDHFKREKLLLNSGFAVKNQYE
jgi:hypothetical protein